MALASAQVGAEDASVVGETWQGREIRIHLTATAKGRASLDGQPRAAVLTRIS